MNLAKFVGVTVLPEYFQSESVNGVLDHLQNVRPRPRP